MVRGKPGAWDPQVCLEWGFKLLTTLREVASGRDGGSSALPDQPEKGQVAVWRATFTPGQGVRIQRLGDEELEDVASDGDGPGDEKRVERIGFLPRWFFVQG